MLMVTGITEILQIKLNSYTIRDRIKYTKNRSRIATQSGLVQDFIGT